MAFNKQKLIDGFKEAFSMGMTTDPDGKDNVKPRHTESELADKIASTITSYAADAQISFLPGPFIFPNLIPPHTPPVLPDLSVYPMSFYVKTAAVGQAALAAAFAASFASQDPNWSIASAGCVAYAATLTVFQSFVPNSGVGTSIMAVPPQFGVLTASGLAGADSDVCAEIMAGIVDASFRSCIFNGVGLTVLLGVGPIIGQPLF